MRAFKNANRKKSFLAQTSREPLRKRGVNYHVNLAYHQSGLLVSYRVLKSKEAQMKPTEAL